jgi:hypothetical protein
METMLIPVLSFTTPPSVARLISGLFILQWTWPSIFWFVAIASALTFAVIVVFLPEACRSIVGNGSKSRLLRCHAPANLTLCPPSEGSLDIHPRETGSRSKSMFLTGPFATAALLRQPSQVTSVEINRDQNGNTSFPIEYSRFRSTKYFLVICGPLIAAYGWSLQVRAVCKCFSSSYFWQRLFAAKSYNS